MPPKAKPQTKSTILADPDALGDAGNAELVAQMLANIQEQAARARLLLVANAASEDDPFPGETLGPNGEVTTYKMRLADLSSAQRRLLDAQPKAVLDAVRKIVALKRQQADRLLAEADG